jgi:hypothetical protein
MLIQLSFENKMLIQLTFANKMPIQLTFKNKMLIFFWRSYTFTGLDFPMMEDYWIINSVNKIVMCGS